LDALLYSPVRDEAIENLFYLLERFVCYARELSRLVLRKHCDDRERARLISTVILLSIFISLDLKFLTYAGT